MKKYLSIFLMLVCSVTAAGYTRITASNGLMPKWSSLPIPYWTNERGYSGIANGSEFNAVHASFQSWQNIPAANIQFEYKGTTSARTVGRDGINLISFADDSTPLGSSAIAATFSFFRTEGNALVLDESDSVFSQMFSYSTSAEPNKFDIQGVLTHEVGHFLGLDHSGMVSSVMVPFGAISTLDQRNLSYDDIAGIVEIYPRASALPPVGQIRGTILAGTTRVFGAHVVAVGANGTAQVGTLTQPDGTYLLRYLPPGTYRVFAEPLDLPVTEQNISTSFYHNIKTDFGTTYFGGVSTLGEAQSINVPSAGTAVADFQTLPASSTGLNLTRPGFAPRVQRGASGTLSVGGQDITAGTSFSSSNSGLVLGSPTYGGATSSISPTSASMSLSVASSTPLGPKNLAVNRGAAASIVSGAIVVVEVSPSNISVTPASGPIEGGTNVTIRGSNFRSGAGVFFGGLPATNVQVADAGTILATAPANAPSAVNVVVINVDGTWGTASQAFTYSSAPPTITRVTPVSGPPGTSVTIEGDHFDSRTQNVEVRFNGVLGRVVSSTATAITTIVPFGTTTGPITVTVFGQAATGPVFTITSAPISSNVAGGGYNFIDATGGTRLNFSNIDDSVVFVTLPFDFSLFRDTYLAGSRISIATNGYLSLEGDSSAEFQNSPLPAQTIARPAGGTAAVPPALIAAFWDDLYVTSGSSVTVNTFGTAPNRKFVIQWSTLSVLDEAGTNLNASLTFEAILFEGSNDIQFVYQSLTGARSDGSSATVGMQDSKRSTGVQTGFNQAILRSGSFFSYHFQNGSYTLVVADTTPPTRPVVTDGGAATQSRTELSASWTSDDPESGIREFQYAIGRTAGAADIRPFTSTTLNSVVATGLNLDAGATYYFAVRATNNAGMTSVVGVSDGIRVDTAFQPEVKVIPAAPQGNSEFSGIALYAPAAMSVVLKAMDANGNLISGTGVRNPTTVTLSAGQQYARLISEIFGVQTFDGWIETEASAPGLGIFTATGSWDLTRLDGAAVRALSSDFVLFHAGASAVLVNSSTRTASVSMGSQPLTIPPRSRIGITVPGIVRVQSSEPLAAIERTSSTGKLSLSPAVAVSDAPATLVFPHAVTGGGYTSILSLANVGTQAQDVRVTNGTSTAMLRVEGNSSTRVSIGELFQLSAGTLTAGGLRVSSGSALFGSTSPVLMGVLDIENETSLVTMGARPAATNIVFPHVAHGNGLFTGLAFAAGDRAAAIAIEVYDSAGSAPRTTAIALEANQQRARLISEFISSISVQMGGYIRIRSDQPIWAWEIYGSGDVMASGPPL